jgi:hypothetical protein
MGRRCLSHTPTHGSKLSGVAPPTATDTQTSPLRGFSIDVARMVRRSVGARAPREIMRDASRASRQRPGWPGRAGGRPRSESNSRTWKCPPVRLSWGSLFFKRFSSAWIRQCVELSSQPQAPSTEPCYTYDFPSRLGRPICYQEDQHDGVCCFARGSRRRVASGR